MKLVIIFVAALTARLAHADVYEVCKGESKRVVAGTGRRGA